MKAGKTALRIGAAFTALLGAGALAQQAGGSFADQVEHGRTLYARNCAACHGADLSGGQFAGPVKGPAFLTKWGEVPADDLLTYISTSMPPGGGGNLSASDYAALAALIVQENGGTADLPLAAGSALTLPAFVQTEEANALGIGGITANHPMPDWPEPVDRFANYTPVTQAMLDNPAPENWLTWRRSHDGQGFSPLDQIDRENVGRLTVAWAQALPAGQNMAEPLVRDGVLYVFGHGDQLFAFDAADGRPLWQYRRQLPEDAIPVGKKSLALYDDKIFMATSDMALVALDARTGRPVWDVALTDKPGFRNPGGPLAADGVIMQGLTTQEPGGGLIVAVDADTGEKLWEFETVAKPGQQGGDSWNGLPADERRGGSVWTSGTYDAQTGLALWGVAQTYDTGPLRDVKPGENNDSLFTNSTLAFVPRTGELKWYFQHMKNDQYDLDWVFERVVGHVMVDGRKRRVVMTGGKEGLFDTLDAETGEYISTVDMGFQDFIVAIDPETGEKTVDPTKLPGRDQPAVFMCPHAGGGRNWSPTAYVESAQRLFVNARDTCMEMVPVEGGFLTSGVDIYYSAPADSDGRFGILQSLDMESGEVLWERKRRAPYNMGILATAGGLLFSGGMDRKLIAFDQDTGEEIWSSGLAGVPNASPISYAVDGRQYIAVVTGSGNPLAFGLPGFTPEIPLPPVASGAVTVYALPRD